LFIYLTIFVINNSSSSSGGKVPRAKTRSEKQTSTVLAKGEVRNRSKALAKT